MSEKQKPTWLNEVPQVNLSSQSVGEALSELAEGLQAGWLGYAEGELAAALFGDDGKDVVLFVSTGKQDADEALLISTCGAQEFHFVDVAAVIAHRCKPGEVLCFKKG